MTPVTDPASGLENPGGDAADWQLALRLGAWLSAIQSSTLTPVHCRMSDAGVATQPGQPSGRGLGAAPT